MLDEGAYLLSFWPERLKHGLAPTKEEADPSEDKDGVDEELGISG